MQNTDKDKLLKMLPAKRHLVSLPVSSEKYGSATKAQLRMKNISSSGALLSVLKSSESFHKGEIIRLTVDLFELKKIKMVSAEIIWVKKASVGVAFIKPNDVLPKLFERY